VTTLLPSWISGGTSKINGAKNNGALESLVLYFAASAADFFPKRANFGMELRKSD